MYLTLSLFFLSLIQTNTDARDYALGRLVGMVVGIGAGILIAVMLPRFFTKKRKRK